MSIGKNNYLHLAISNYNDDNVIKDDDVILTMVKYLIHEHGMDPRLPNEVGSFYHLEVL